MAVCAGAATVPFGFKFTAGCGWDLDSDCDCFLSPLEAATGCPLTSSAVVAGVDGCAVLKDDVTDPVGATLGALGAWGCEGTTSTVAKDEVAGFGSTESLGVEANSFFDSPAETGGGMGAFDKASDVEADCSVSFAEVEAGGLAEVSRDSSFETAVPRVDATAGSLPVGSVVGDLALTCEESAVVGLVVAGSAIVSLAVTGAESEAVSSAVVGFVIVGLAVVVRVCVSSCR